MQIPKQYMSNWVGYWSYVADHMTQTWDLALRDIEKRKYSPTKMMSDVAGSWMVAATGWCLPAHVDGKPDVLLFVIPATAEAAPAKTVPVFAARCPKGDPEIVLIDGPTAGADEKKIGEKQYFAHWSKRKHFVAVGLKDLAEPNATPPKTIAKGTYRSLVRVGDEPIAFIYIEVS
jgi:hypothetical protein